MILTINMEIGLITPPVWLNLFVVKSIAPQVPASTSADEDRCPMCRSCCSGS